ncbi:hypothetical protein Pelo_5069 [Pelomyxa schiedti]|nr:hypothetical protein Pelo_5069 [Pelomyxa schiedti]
MKGTVLVWLLLTGAWVCGVPTGRGAAVVDIINVVEGLCCLGTVAVVGGVRSDLGSTTLAPLIGSDFLVLDPKKVRTTGAVSVDVDPEADVDGGGGIGAWGGAVVAHRDDRGVTIQDKVICTEAPNAAWIYNATVAKSQEGMAWMTVVDSFQLHVKQEQIMGSLVPNTTRISNATVCIREQVEGIKDREALITATAKCRVQWKQ